MKDEAPESLRGHENERGQVTHWSQAPLASPLRYMYLIMVGLTVVAFDQILKLLVTQRFGGGSHLDILGGLVRLDYTRNTGAAFGVYQGGAVFLAGVAVVVSAGIVYYYRKVSQSPLLLRTALGSILGGALGNLIDRLRLGYVVDFIDLRWWPVFNVADSAVVVGVVLLGAYSLVQSPRERQR